MRTPALLLALGLALPVSVSAAATATSPPTAAPAVDLAKLAAGQQVGAWTADAVYLDGHGEPFGGRFTHRRSGFTLDLLRIESVPQGYTWVNSIPVGDQGEPHTQEHLLLGKGTKGRSFAGLDTMWLSTSTAFTQQWRTSYHFSTTAGEEVFYRLLDRQLDALLHPNYTDEEIRREVRSFGVASNPDGTLRLEEKGSVYNEMTSSMTNRYRVLFRAIGQAVYGERHPLSYNSGGEPSGIRTMKPEDIRRFHDANYDLANMGTMVALPRRIAVGDALARIDAILGDVDPAPRSRESATATPFPKPHGAPAGTVVVADYPQRNDQQPSPVAVAWPATRDLPVDELVLLELFADAFAGEPGTNLYRLFVDSRTRTMETGATSVSASVERDPGHAVEILLDNVAVASLAPASLVAIRQQIVDELARVAALPDGSPELRDLNERVLSRVQARERQLATFVDTPPAWGGRGTGSDWMDQLLLLEKAPGFRKSVTLAPQLAAIRAALAGDRNPWRERLPRWGLVGVEPYVLAAKPSPELLEREDRERAERAEREAKRLAGVYGVADEQQALLRYRNEQDTAAAVIEAEAKKLPRPDFVEHPPMTLDDDLRFSQSAVAGVPLVASTFEGMTSATVGLALRVDGVAPERLRYLSLLPDLLTSSGVVENGTPVPYEEMSERLRREILGLDAGFLTNPRTGRVELALTGSGLGTDEAKRALGWMRLVLASPDWRVENLPRLRDLVDADLSSLRTTMQRPEEAWVNDPAIAWQLQTNPYHLAAASFLTRTHNALRLRWLLMEAPAADRDALARWFGDLAARSGSRDERRALLAKPETTAGLSPAATAIAREAVKDLEATLPEIPDASLAADWTYLVTAMRDDLMVPPATALAELDGLRRDLLAKGRARLWTVGSAATQAALAAEVEKLVATLGAAPFSPAPAGTERILEARLRGRDASAAAPRYVGLLAPNMKGGVVITSVPSVHWSDAGARDAQLDYLASRLYAGYGPHGIFLKTIGAGLAYSNGIRATVTGARTGYYAERTPEIPQTVAFVIDAVKTAEPDYGLADYAVAQVFGESRAAGTYEARAAAMAGDLADGQRPEQVRAFREAVLALRREPDLGRELFARKDAVHARILPGYDGKPQTTPGAVYFAIGPDRQLDAWDAYLRSSAGDGAHLDRLWPRDYWMP